MYSLYQKGLDYSIIQKELEEQLTGLGPKAGKDYSSAVYRRWRLLSGRFGITVPVGRKSIKK